MEMIFCPNCGKLAGYKRALGFGTFFAVLLTAGFWLLAIPFYPKRCITCGLGKSGSVPWYKTWRLGLVLVVGMVALGVATYKLFLPEPSRSVAAVDSRYRLLGFQCGMNPVDAKATASSIGFRLEACKKPSEQWGYTKDANPLLLEGDDDWRYCRYVRQADEVLSLNFWRDELEMVDYQFGIRRYNSLSKELSARYGRPRVLAEPHDPTSKLSDEWGGISEEASLSLIERADHSGGVATLHSNGGKYDEYIRKATLPYQGPPSIPPQALPAMKRAEQFLFGERTPEVDGLGVTSETLQGAFAVTTHCQAHSCPNHYAVWTLDLSTGQTAGALADQSEIVVYLGDYESAENLPPVLQAEIEDQRAEGLPSPKRVRYVSHQ
jgi:hypothetical protein